jgi:hypothetical protein
LLFGAVAEVEEVEYFLFFAAQLRSFFGDNISILVFSCKMVFSKYFSIPINEVVELILVSVFFSWATVFAY